jgi:hypothetical protein
MAPMAVENCKSIACVKEKVKIVLYFILMPSESSYNIFQTKPMTKYAQYINHRPAENYRQTLSHNVVSSTPRNERDSNSQLKW